MKNTRPLPTPIRRGVYGNSSLEDLNDGDLVCSADGDFERCDSVELDDVELADETPRPVDPVTGAYDRDW